MEALYEDSPFVLIGNWLHSHPRDPAKERPDINIINKIKKMAEDGVETTKMRINIEPPKNLELGPNERRHPGPRYFYAWKRKLGDFPFKSKSRNVFEGL